MENVSPPKSKTCTTHKPMPSPHMGTPAFIPIALPYHPIKSRRALTTPRASHHPPADWRAFRARLFRSETCSTSTPVETAIWAHPVPFIEKGTLLIASPQHFTDEHSYAFFANTIVYIIEHTNFSTAGLILNRPIARALPSLPQPTRLYLGGPVGLDTVIVLHDDQSFGRVIVGDVRAAGFREVSQRVEKGLVNLERCTFFCGYSGWVPGQLEEEVGEGVWYTCAASDALIMKEFGDDAVSNVLRLLGGKFEDIAKKLDDRRKSNK